jgi:hypothetical protein
MKTLILSLALLIPACDSPDESDPHTFATQEAAREACPNGWAPFPTDYTLVAWTCQCEQSCGPCPEGWHKAGEWLETCEADK